MELPVIVLIDVENSKIHLFGKYNNTLDFNKSFLLRIYLKDEKVLYINDLVEASCDDILELINSNFTVENSVLYLRSKVEGFTTIKKSNLILYGPKLPKKLEDLKILENTHLQELIKTGKVEIIGEDEVKKKNLNQNKKKEPSIIIDQSIRSLQEGGLTLPEDELEDEIGEETEVIQEAQKIIKDILD